ncbi:hypothetical protein H0X48_00470 [Candidatus Dependentiae bacterium]|nr:hypothetical protein [Candidatus Dependentiae bacterium]
MAENYKAAIRGFLSTALLITCLEYGLRIITNFIGILSFTNLTTSFGHASEQISTSNNLGNTTNQLLIIIPMALIGLLILLLGIFAVKQLLRAYREL